MKVEEKDIVVTDEQVEELASKIQEGILQKEKEGKKDKSIKVETKSGLFVRITKNPYNIYIIIIFYCFCFCFHI